MGPGVNSRVCLKMEDNIDFSFLVEEIPTTQVIRLQSCVRGWLTRKWLRELRVSYEEVFSSIERNSKMVVTWRQSGLCSPVALRARKQKLKTEVPSEVLEKNPDVQNKPTDAFSSIQKVQSWTDEGSVKDKEDLDLASVSSEAHSELGTDVDRYSPVVSSHPTQEDPAVTVEQVEIASEGSHHSVETETESSVPIPCPELQQGMHEESSRDYGTSLRYLSVETQTHSGDSVLEQEKDFYSSADKNGLGQTGEFKCAEDEDGFIDSGRSDLHLKLDSDRQSQISQETVSTTRSVETQHSRQSQTSVKRMNYAGDDSSDRGEEESKSDKTTSRGAVRSPVERLVTDDRSAPSPQQSVGDNGSRRALGSLSHRLEEFDDERIPVRDSRDTPPGNSSVFTNVTSVWDSVNSVTESMPAVDESLKQANPLPQNPEMLRELRKNIALELLWVHQAINSRKNYLRLKSEM